MGIENLQTIARIVIDPKDTNIVYVAVLGHLFGANKARGVYKTTDGGKTWNNVKFIDEDTGITDLVMDQSDSKTLYAASYQRRRTSWGYNGGGPGSGVWKTTDAGKSWTKLQGNGLPEGLLGRIGLDVSRSNPNVIYAQMEVGASAGTGGEEPLTGGGASPSPTPTPSASPAASPMPTPLESNKSGSWRSDDKGKTWRLASNENHRPMYHSQIRVAPSHPASTRVAAATLRKAPEGSTT